MGSRNYCWTLFEQGTGLPTQDSNWTTKVRYCVYQWEMCPDTGRLHMQGYVELVDTAREPAVKKIFGYHTLHLGRRMGSPDEARKYCLKEDTRICVGVEYGVFGGKQGERSDLKAVEAAVKGGARQKQLYEEHFGTMVRYGKGIERAMLYLQPSPRWRDVVVTYIWGEAGEGKTKMVFDLEPDLFVVENDTTWWDGYDGQEAILFDDFYGQVKYSTMLRVLDGYPLMRQNKGGTVWCKWKRVYLTSNEPRSELYKFLTNRTAFDRRFSKTIHMASLTTSSSGPDRTRQDTNEAERRMWEDMKNERGEDPYM